MAVLTADEVLSGPRGRGLCMAVARSLSEEVCRAWQFGDPAQCAVLVRVLEAVDPTSVAEWRDPLAFLEPMDLSVSNAIVLGGTAAGGRGGG